MIKSMIPLFFLVACFTAATCFAASEKMVSVRILGYENPEENVLVAQGPRHLPVEINPYKPGPELKLAPENGELVFYRKAVPAASAPENRASDQWLRLASAKVPRDAESVLLVFIPVPAVEGQDPFRVLVFENDDRDFPAGAIRVINLSPFPVALRMGETASVIGAGREHTVVPAVDEKYRVFARFAAQRVETKWQIFYEGPLSVRPQRRMTCLVAYSSSVLALRDEDGPRLPDGRPAPDMVIVSWQDYLPVMDAGQIAALR